MSLSPETTIFVYRNGDSDSLSVANAYVALYNLDDTTYISVNAPTGQLIPINCSPAEILSDEPTFNTQVLDQIKNAVNDLVTAGHQVYTIVLGFNVPGGFYSDDDIISSVSRISRMNFPFSKQTNNPLYNRQIFQSFNADDAEDAYIVSRIDGPDLSTTMSLINSSVKIQQQLYANGVFYFDPYSDRAGTGAGEYTSDLLYFQNNLLSTLDLDVYSTTYIDPYVDSIIPSVTDDSFIWSWFTNRGSNSFFNDSSSIRFFAYNGDYDGAFTIRDPTDRRWVGLYLRNGYASSAGSMSDPTNSGLLRPFPFFNSLLRASTLGEAYLFSVPYLDWTMTLIGDPLMKVSFPANPQLPSENVLTQDESCRLMFRDLAKSIAFFVNKTESLNAVLNRISVLVDIETELALLNVSSALLNANNDIRRQGQFSKTVQVFFNYITKNIAQSNLSNTYPSLSNYLENRNPALQVSELIYDCQQDDNVLETVDLLPEGYWDFEFVVEDDAHSFAYYNFEIDVSLTPDFTNIVLTKKSTQSLIGWLWEKNTNDFEPLTYSGVTSAYVGRRVRFEAQQSDYLPRATILYLRYRQQDQNSIFGYRYSTEVVYS